MFSSVEKHNSGLVGIIFLPGGEDATPNAEENVDVGANWQPEPATVFKSLQNPWK